MSPDPLHLDRLPKDRLPVVLVGGINLVRSLGLAGIPAIVAMADPDEPAFDSRYCAARYPLPPLAKGEAAVDALVRLGDRLTRSYGRRAPLMYGSDDALELIYTHRDRLERYFLFLINDPQVAGALIAKDRFQALAEERGLPVPRGLAWEGDGPGTLRGTAGPVLVKPRMKIDWHHTALCQRLFDGGEGKARVFASGAEALAEPAVGLHRDQLTIQEYIPGGDADLWSYHGFADETGEVLAAFVGRKIRTYPTGCGESAYIELARDEALEAAGRDAARRLPLKGVFKMDFKRDASSGRWYLLEVNARFNLWHYLGARHGVNLVRVAYDYLVDGRRPGPLPYTPRYRWLSIDLDIKAYREMSRRGEIGLFGWLASLAAAPKIYNVLSWTDPVPFVRFIGGRIARRLRRGPGKLMTVLRQWRSTAS